MSYNNYQQYNQYDGQPPSIANTGFNPYTQFQPSTPTTISNQQSSIDQLSFLTAEEQQKYYTLFTHSTNTISIAPDIARSILLKSSLTPHQLAKIWDLSDLNKSGDLLFPEFALALYLCNTVLKGGELPYDLNQRVKDEVIKAVDKINFAIPEESSSSGQEQQLVGTSSGEIKDVFNQNNDPVVTPFQPQSTFGLQQQATAYNQPNNNVFSSNVPIQSQATGFGFQNQSNQPQQPQQQQQQPIHSQATGITPALNNQTTGFNQSSPQFFTSPPQTQQVSLNPQFTGFQTSSVKPISQKTSINQSSSLDSTLGLTNNQPIRTQLTGGAPLSSQVTGLQPTTTGPAPFKPLTQQPTTTTGNINLVPLQSVTTGSIIGPITSQPTGNLIPLLKPQATGLVIKPLTQQKTGVGQNSFFIDSLLQAQASQAQEAENNSKFQIAAMYANATISQDEKKLFNKIFDNFDKDKKGLLDAKTSSEIFRKSGLNREDLEQIWDLVTRANQTHLDKESFQIGMWLVYKRINGSQLPEYLPDSLKPSSLKILDSVKNQLKTGGGGSYSSMKKTSNSKMDGSRFKNNDDELVGSSSRHRRRTNSTFNSPSTSSPTNNNNIVVELTTEELKKKIWEKTILLEDLKSNAENFKTKEKTLEEDDLQIIEDLKRQIKELPQSSLSATDSQIERLKQRLDILLRQVPQLNQEIHQLIEQIKNNKIHLFQLQNTETSGISKYLKGTGPNGEITDFDRRKFESRRQLAEKMSKLTGRPLDPEFANVGGSQEETSTKIKDYSQQMILENEQNRKMVDEIVESISDVAKSVASSLEPVNQIDKEQYKKFELGIGLQPEVQELVKSFKVSQLSSKFSSALSFDSPTSRYVPTPTPTNQYVPTPTPTNQYVPTPTSHKLTAEERRAQIRARVQERIKSKYSALTSSSSPTNRRSNTPSGSDTPTLQMSTIDKSATPVPQINIEQSTTSVKLHEMSQFPALEDVQPNFSNHNETSSDDDDDDEEEYQRMEEIRKMKRMERDARLAELK